jgi:hypothetical protein
VLNLTTLKSVLEISVGRGGNSFLSTSGAVFAWDERRRIGERVTELRVRGTEDEFLALTQDGANDGKVRCQQPPCRAVPSSTLVSEVQCTARSRRPW